MMYVMVIDYREAMNQLQTTLPVSNALNNLQIFFTVFNVVKNSGDFLEVRLTRFFIIIDQSKTTIQDSESIEAFFKF